MSGSRFETKPYPRLAEMRWDPTAGQQQRSRKQCGNVADLFDSFVAARGIAVISESDPRHPTNLIAAALDPNPIEQAISGAIDIETDVDWSALYGYTDGRYRRRRDKTHQATVVDVDGEILMIDWTAGQYGYAEWPMVQRYDPVDNVWQREFTLRQRPRLGDIDTSAIAVVPTEGTGPKPALHAEEIISPGGR